MHNILVFSEFDINGKLLENTWFSTFYKEIEQIHFFSYQNKKTILKVEFYENKKLKRTKTVEYQSENELINNADNYSMFLFEFYKTDILFNNPMVKFKYDKKGNWIYKHDTDALNKGFCQRIVTRKITYY